MNACRLGLRVQCWRQAVRPPRRGAVGWARPGSVPAGCMAPCVRWRARRERDGFAVQGGRVRACGRMCVREGEGERRVCATPVAGSVYPRFREPHLRRLVVAWHWHWRRKSKCKDMGALPQHHHDRRRRHGSTSTSTSASASTSTANGMTPAAVPSGRAPLGNGPCSLARAPERCQYGIRAMQ